MWFLGGKGKRIEFLFWVKMFVFRTSRADQDETPRHVARPSSLPYKAATSVGGKTKLTPPRRAASSSLSRRAGTKSNVPK